MRLARQEKKYSNSCVARKTPQKTITHPLQVKWSVPNKDLSRLEFLSVTAGYPVVISLEQLSDFKFPEYL